MRLHKVLAIAAALALPISGGALAADMAGGMMDPAPQLAQPQFEHGTGWYLRGSIAASKDNSPQLSTDVAAALRRAGAGLELGVGYNVNRWFRMDMSAGWHRANAQTLNGALVTCPYALTGLTSQGTPAFQLGYLWDSSKETCTPKQTSLLSRSDVMLNGYFDLGTWAGITPYIGAGAGVSSIRARTTLDYLKTSDGSIYAADLTPTGTYPHLWIDLFGNPITPQPTVSFAKQVWSRVVNKSVANLSWALMGGFAFNVTENLKLDVGYRYLSAGSFTSLPSPVTGLTKTSKLTSQEVRLGFRYTVD